MPKLPVVSGKKVVKALSQIGYEFDHQIGSHMILRNSQGNRISVPNHSELDRGTLKSILRDAGLTVQEFIELL
ncbi:MAG: type II toxin-antitoxin system HicA family toxin [Candidatus Thermoplasmatota archaeon]|nr:type II toxin-antitoxin system HicA family toxin [Candidatus Thermoplasmatota archaeon]